MELLKGINAKQAAAHSVAGGHSIWELTLHIETWLGAVRRRLAGDRAQLSDAEDWPPVAAPTDNAWTDTTNAIKQAHTELRSAILSLNDAQLDEPIIAGMSSVYVTLHGVIQHTLYHAGQIAILKKTMSEAETG